MARKMYAVAPDGYVVVSQTDRDYSHFVIAPDSDGSGKWHRVSAHGSHALAAKSLSGVRANGHGNCIIVPCTDQKPDGPTARTKPVAQATLKGQAMPVAEGAAVEQFLGLPVHPAASEYPLIEGEQFDALVDDIAKHGLREKIELHEGQIVDGRNRARALEAAGVTSADDYTMVAPIPEGMTVEEYVASKNLHRRHLTQEQWKEKVGKIALAIKKSNQGKPRKDQRNAIKETAAATGTPERTVARALKGAEAKEQGKPAPKANPDKPKADEMPTVTSPTAPVTRLLKEMRLGTSLLREPKTRLTQAERDKLLALAKETVERLEGWQF